MRKLRRLLWYWMQAFVRKLRRSASSVLILASSRVFVYAYPIVQPNAYANTFLDTYAHAHAHAELYYAFSAYADYPRQHGR